MSISLGGGKIFSSFSPRLPPTSPYLDASPYSRPTPGAGSVGSGVYRYPTGAPPTTNPSSIPPPPLTSNASSIAPYSVRSLATGAGGSAAGESQASMALAYNQLMSSMAAHFHQQQHLQQQQQHGLGSGITGKLGPASGASSAPSPGVLENLEKLAALAAGASSSASSARNDLKSSVAGN